MKEHIFIGDYFVAIGVEKDCIISLNGFNQIDDTLTVAYNLVNDTWYFKFVKAVNQPSYLYQWCCAHYGYSDSAALIDFPIS
jgi:hypothetical protein